MVHHLTQTAAAEPSAFTDSSPVVAVLDDEPNIQVILSRWLTLNGFDPVQMSSMRDVFWVVDHRRVDAFLLDLRLKSGESGLLVLAWLRAQPAYADTPVVILTGERNLTVDAEEAIRRHRADVFFKGQSLQPLMEQLKQILADCITH